ncbi:hypothetical protein D3C75_1071670 [compost metagenome]
MLLTVMMVIRIPARVASSARPNRRDSSSLLGYERIALRMPSTMVAKNATNSVSPIKPICRAMPI